MDSNKFSPVAAGTHPLIIPPMVYLVISGKNEWEVLLFTLIIPLVLAAQLGIRISTTDHPRRRATFFTMAALYAITAVINTISYGETFWGFGLFEGWAALMLLAAFMVKGYNISWHAAGWGWLLFYNIFLLTVHGTHPVTVFLTVLTLIMGVAIMYWRWIKKAHTTREIITGYILGLAIAAIFIFGSPYLSM
ncbi:MAG: hypothetical protein H6606_06215 [Flavobacteriales bacterium]|nr:hypothetical protein [Flavobacteriales bacterium]